MRFMEGFSVMKTLPDRTIVITLDYEIYGDGTGDVKEVLYVPTQRLLTLLEKNRVKMTVFFEIEEYLFFRQHREIYMSAIGYDPALLIEKQLEKMVSTGHEIALHIHPQWIGASLENSKIHLVTKNEFLIDVFENEDSLKAYLENRVFELQALVRKFDKNYQVQSFRAGGHCLHGEAVIFKILMSLGITVDSSVVPGLYRKGVISDIDYLKAPQGGGYWYVDDDVSHAQLSGSFVEIPVYSQMKFEFQKIKFKRIKAKFFSKGGGVNSAAARVLKYDFPKTPYAFIKFLFRKGPIKFDFCHLSFREMVKFLNENQEKNSPLVMIGHNKEYFNDRDFELFLKHVLREGVYNFETIGGVSQKIKRTDYV